MPPFVGFAVEVCRKTAVGFRRDDGLDPCLFQRFADSVGIKRSVGEERAAGVPLDQRRRSAQVVGLPGQQAEIDQVAERIGQGHDLGRYAAARTSDGLALRPPFAP